MSGDFGIEYVQEGLGLLDNEDTGKPACYWCGCAMQPSETLDGHIHFHPNQCIRALKRALNLMAGSLIGAHRRAVELEKRVKELEGK